MVVQILVSGGALTGRMAEEARLTCGAKNVVHLELLGSGVNPFTLSTLPIAFYSCFYSSTSSFSAFFESCYTFSCATLLHTHTTRLQQLPTTPHDFSHFDTLAYYTTPEKLQLVTFTSRNDQPLKISPA